MPLAAAGLAALLMVVLVVRACSSRNDGSADSAGATAVEAVVEEPKETTVSLAMIGDILFHYQVRESGLQANGTRNYDHVFAHILDELEDKDLKVLNQETPLAGEEFGYSGYPMFNGPQEIGDAEVKAGFNVILKATNHALDMGYNGIAGELDFWRTEHPDVTVIGERSLEDVEAEAQGVQASSADGTADVKDDDAGTEKGESEDAASKTGSGADDEDEGKDSGSKSGTSSSDDAEKDETEPSYDLYVYQKDDFRIALLNFTESLNGIADPSELVSRLERSHVKDAMARARSAADMIVVFPHWGTEYMLAATDAQREWAELLVDEGADLIIGGHPHVIEPLELLESDDGKVVPCFWSVGNFISTSPTTESLVGGMAEATLVKDADGSCSVRDVTFIPLVTHLGLTTDMTTYFVRDWTDALASTNSLYTSVNQADETGMTTEWLADFCEGVLGDGYDAKKAVLSMDVPAALSTASTDGPGAGKSSDQTDDDEARTQTSKAKTSDDEDATQEAKDA